MARVYIAGAMMPTGGAYMAYHLGRLLHLHFGYEPFDIAIYKVEKKLFRYDTHIPSISLHDIESLITDDDILIANPFFSPFLFGLRLKGRKIMYVQDFRTFQSLDCHFDMYVSVSSLVQRALEAIYGIASPVIPAFIQLGRMPPVAPWHERPPGSALVYVKNPSHEHRYLIGHLTHELQASGVHLDLSNVIEGRGMSHQDFLAALGSVRYFINMSLAEGFGLVPLEAMAMGTLVTGVDGLAGRDYMRHGENCLVGSVKDLRHLHEVLHRAVTNHTLAERCAEAGKITAKHYGYGPFKNAWLKQLSDFLQVEPVHA